jgi:hypothetical protein
MRNVGTGKTEQEDQKDALRFREALRARWSTRVAFLVFGLAPGAAWATTVLTVDLSTTVRPVTHAASGSLYGVLETRWLPAAQYVYVVSPMSPMTVSVLPAAA